MEEILVDRMKQMGLDDFITPLESEGVKSLKEDLYTLQNDDVIELCRRIQMNPYDLMGVRDFEEKFDDGGGYGGGYDDGSFGGGYGGYGGGYRGELSYENVKRAESISDLPYMPVYNPDYDAEDELPDFPPGHYSPYGYGSDGYYPQGGGGYQHQHQHHHHSFSDELPALPKHRSHSGSGGLPALPKQKSSGNCLQCGKRPVYVDPHNGKRSPCCGRTCLKLYKKSNPLGSPVGGGGGGGTAAPPGKCVICHVKDVYVNDNGPSKTCSRRHQKEFEKNGPRLFNALQPNALPEGHSGTICLVETCDTPVYKDSKGVEHQFCSKKCREKMSKMANAQGGAALIEMKKGFKKYNNISKQLSITFAKKTSVATFDNIDKIYIVHNPTRWAKYCAYRRKLETKHSTKSSWKDKVNQQRRFHGTHCECGVPAGKPCGSAKCGICGIVTQGFDLTKYKTKSKWGRFGNGIYLTDVAAKAHDYTGKTMKHSQGSGNRWMLLCHTALGEVQVMAKGDQNLDVTKLPPNIDSVRGKTKKEDPTADLNYGECVVYDPDAVYPCYVINYKFKKGQ